MPTYRYEAVGGDGQRAEGVLEASDSTQAVSLIRQSYDVVLKLEEIAAPRTDPLEKFQKLNLKVFALMCKQFAIILKAGLPLVQTVDLVASQISDNMLKKMLEAVSLDIANGWSLSYSFSQRGKGRLPVTFLETIRAGEESGDLVRSFDRMSTYYDRMTKTRAKATSALIYPAFLSVVAVFVIIIIMTYAVPTFAGVFESMGTELPLPTRIVIGMSDFFSRYIWVLLGTAAGLIFLLRLYAGTAGGRIRMAQFRLTLPILGKLAAMTSASQFAHTMAAMLSAGMPILKALDTASRSVSNAHLSAQIQSVIPGVEGGRPLGECLNACRDLPPLLVQMTAMGEATGSLEGTLEIQAEYYDNEVENLSARALALLEPIIICVMAIFVVLVLLSIYLPMFSLYGSI